MAAPVQNADWDMCRNPLKIPVKNILEYVSKPVKNTRQKYPLKNIR